MAEYLNSAGYGTIGISGNTWISPEFGFNKGFDKFAMKWDLFWDGPDLTTVAREDTIFSQFQEVLRQTDLIQFPKSIAQACYSKFIAGRYDDGAKASTNRAVNWIEEERNSSRPFFMFINYIEPHLQYDPPSQYRDQFLPDEVNREMVSETNQDPWAYLTDEVQMDESDFRILKSLYQAELAYLDTQIERLLNTLQRESILDDTVLLVVGDHGENIGEYGLMDHQYCLYDTLLQVPLMIRYPSEFPSNEVVEGLVETRDVLPTVLQLAGIEVNLPKKVSKNSLVPGSAGTVSTRDFTISEYVTPQPAIEKLAEQYECSREELAEYDQALRAIRTDEWKLIERSGGDYELSDLGSPSEKEDISSSHDGLVTRLRETLRGECGELQVGSKESRHISSSSQKRLKDLGYL